MTSSELVDAALRIYQRLGVTFLRLTVLPAVFCTAGFAFVTQYVLPQLYVSQQGASTAAQIEETITTLGLAVFVGGPLFLTGLAYGGAIVVRLVSDWMLGVPPDPKAAQRVARESLGRLFLVNLRVMLLASSGILTSGLVMGLGGWLASQTRDDNVTAGLVAGLGVIGLLASFVLFLGIVSRHALSLPVAVIEGVRAKDAGRRSVRLLKNHGIHLAGTMTVWSVYFLVGFVALVLVGGFAFFNVFLSLSLNLSKLFAGSLLQPLMDQALSMLPLYLVVWTLAPVWATAMTILYYDRRIRLEGYDIESLAAEIPQNYRATSPRA